MGYILGKKLVSLVQIYLIEQVQLGLGLVRYTKFRVRSLLGVEGISTVKVEGCSQGREITF